VRHRDVGPPADPSGPDQQPAYGDAAALLDVLGRFLDAAPEDRSGEDRTVVLVNVSADSLAAGGEDVPAGTFPVGDPTCSIDGVGSIEPATADRLACDADLLGPIVERHGDLSALGRTRRLVSKAPRRALMNRDTMCRFPGCAKTRHQKAHHSGSRAAGSRTDIDSVILLCGSTPRSARAA
jgi:hypothetical protein